MFNNVLKYRSDLRAMVNSEEGKRVLARWKAQYVDKTAFGQDEKETYANLALKEFIQGLINEVKNVDGLDDIIKNSINKEGLYNE